MATLPGGGTRAAAGLLLAAACACARPDSSGLFDPLASAGGSAAESAAPGVETSVPPLQPSASSGSTEAPRVSELGGAAGAGERASPAVPEPEPPPLPSPLDAGVEPDAAAPLPEAECAGAPLAGVCWYLSADGESCAGACASRGGFSAASLAVIGTPDQGGSGAGCAAVLQALGVAVDAVQEGLRMDGLGLGCHVFLAANGAVTDAWWLTSPEATAAALGVQVRRACGCQR